MSFRWISGVAVGVVLLVIGISCTQTPAASPTQAPAAQPTKGAAPAPTSAPAAGAPTAAPAAATKPAAPAETLKVGFLVGLSGPSTRTGLTIQRFMQMAIDDINAKGGVKVGGKAYRMEAVIADSKGTSEGGREAANKLVLADKVKFVLGSTAGPTAGGQTVTEPAGALILGISPTDASMGTKFPLTFQIGYTNGLSRADVLLGYIAKAMPNVKKIVTVMGDDAYGHRQSDLDESFAKNYGMTVIGKEFYPLDGKDFNPLATRVLRQNPDAIDISQGSYGPLYTGAMKALQEQGFKGPRFGVTGDSVAMMKGEAYLEGFVTTGLIDYNAPIVADAEGPLFKRYLEKWPASEMEVMTVTSYNIPLVLAQALEQAGTVDDGPKVAAALRKGEFDTLWGKQLGKARIVGEKTLGLSAVLEQLLSVSKVEGGKVVTEPPLKATLP